MGSDHQHIPNFIVETDGEHHLPDYAPGEQAKLNTIIDRLQKVDHILLRHNGFVGGDFWTPRDADHLLRRAGTQQDSEGTAPRPDAEIILTHYAEHVGYPERGFMTDTLGADVFPASIKDADSDSFIPGLRIKAIGSDMPLGSAPLIHDFHREAEYFDLAKDAQGTALPRFIGLFETDTATFLIFEDYGRTLTNKERISEDVHEEAEETVRILATAGVAPFEPAHANIKRGRDGLLKIVTLWRSKTITDFNEEYIEKTYELKDDGTAWTPAEIWEDEIEYAVNSATDFF